MGNPPRKERMNMLTENTQVFGMTGRTYRLGKFLGSGGQETVFDVGGQQVVKIYNQQPSPELEKKLYYMVMHPVPSLTDQYGNPILCLAWPRDLVSLPGQGFVGYVMPKIDNSVEIFKVVRCRTDPRTKQIFPNYTWALNVQVARNLALSVHHLHSSGYVIGDMNDKNVLVRPDGGVCILDTDSFDFTDSNSGVHYKCGVGLPDYLAPELQGKYLRGDNALFSEATDDFALAIHIFQLLMDNYHPFTCRSLVRTQDSSAVGKREQRIAEGKCPYIHSYPDCEIPLPAPTMDDILPPNLKADFVQTLDYTAATALARTSQRTPARKWAEDLNVLLKTCENGGLVRCARDPSHFYLREKGSCGLCAVQKRQKNRAVPTPPVRCPQPPVQTPVQPSWQTQDTFFQHQEFYVTEEEALAGGNIPVYRSDGTVEYHLLPSYADIMAYKSKILIKSPSGYIPTSRSGRRTIYDYSDGCLRGFARTGFIKQLFLDILEAFVPMLTWWFGLQLAGYGVDFVSETLFGYDLLRNYALARLTIVLPPFGVSVLTPHFFTVPMNSFWSWFPYLWVLLFALEDIHSTLKQRSECNKELERRRGL